MAFFGSKSPKSPPDVAPPIRKGNAQDKVDVAKEIMEDAKAKFREPAPFSEDQYHTPSPLPTQAEQDEFERRIRSIPEELSKGFAAARVDLNLRAAAQDARIEKLQSLLENFVLTSSSRQQELNAQLARDRLLRQHSAANNNAGAPLQPNPVSAASASSQSLPSVHSVPAVVPGFGRSYAVVPKPHPNLDEEGLPKRDSSLADDYTDNDVGSDDENFSENWSGMKRGGVHQRRMKRINGGRTFAGALGSRMSEFLDNPDDDIFAEVGVDGLTRKKTTTRTPPETEHRAWLISLHRHQTERVAAHGDSSVWGWRQGVTEYILDYYSSSQAKGEPYAMRYAICPAIEDATSHPSWDALSPFAVAIRRRAFMSVQTPPLIEEGLSKYRMLLGVPGQGKELQALKYAKSAELRFRDPTSDGSTADPSAQVLTSALKNLFGTFCQPSGAPLPQGAGAQGNTGQFAGTGTAGSKSGTTAQAPTPTTVKPCYGCKKPANPPHSSSYHAKQGWPYENVCLNPVCGHNHTNKGVQATDCQVEGCPCVIVPGTIPLWKGGKPPKQLGL